MRDQRSSNGENITTRSDRTVHLAMFRLPCSHDKRRDNFDFPHYVWTKVRGKVTWTSKIRPDIDSSKPQAYDVLGRIIRIDDDGRPDMQPLLRISTVDNDLNSTLQASVGSPVSGIAFNPDTGEYLVTWLGSHLVDENDQPYVQRLNLQGELIGTPVRIYAGIR